MKNNNDKQRVTKFAPLYSCPVPNCGHSGDYITNVHCVNHHGMTKQEVITKYGEPIARELDFNKMKKNRAMIEPTKDRWAGMEEWRLSQNVDSYLR